MVIKYMDSYCHNTYRVWRSPSACLLTLYTCSSVSVKPEIITLSITSDRHVLTFWRNLLHLSSRLQNMTLLFYPKDEGWTILWHIGKFASDQTVTFLATAVRTSDMISLWMLSYQSKWDSSKAAFKEMESGEHCGLFFFYFEWLVDRHFFQTWMSFQGCWTARSTAVCNGYPPVLKQPNPHKNICSLSVMMMQHFITEWQFFLFSLKTCLSGQFIP